MKQELELSFAAQEVHPKHSAQSLNQQYADDAMGISGKQTVAVVIDGDATSKHCISA